jgi:hypothetical protein
MGLRMELFKFFDKWLWAWFILATILNSVSYWKRARSRIAANPGLQDGYRSLIKGFLFWGNLPWVVMGVGCVSGTVRSMFDYFRPRDGNPYVLAFFGVVILEWLLLANWLIRKGGAQKLVDYPGLVNFEFKTARGVILYWGLSQLGGLIGILWAFFGPEVPRFPR